MEFELLIIGSDINAYHMARSYHEEYNKKAYLIGSEPMAVTYYSKILNFDLVPDLNSTTTFLKTLNSFYDEHSDKKILLIGSTNTYVRLIIENKDELKDHFIFHTYDIDTLNMFLVRENFYREFKGLDTRDTYVYDINTDLNLFKINDIGYPLIIRLGTTTFYHELGVKGSSKVYVINDICELLDTISAIRNTGYKKHLIIQRQLDNDDSLLFDCVSYVDRFGKVALMSFAQIGLQEYNDDGVGSATVLVNGFNEYGGTKKVVDTLKETLESINYRGIIEFKFLYNKSNKKYEVIEVNPRQARSSYYLTFAGYNLVKYLVDDLILGKKLEYQFADEKVCLSLVPKKIINKYVKSEKLKAQIDTLYNNKKYVNPIKYSKDKTIKRIIWLKSNDLNYSKMYKDRSTI